MFRISKEEKNQIILQFVHLNNLKFSSVLPMVFTEHGAVMLASIINSERAIETNIQIVRVFTNIRQMLFDNSELRYEIEKIKKKVGKSLMERVVVGIISIISFIATFYFIYLLKQKRK